MHVEFMVEEPSAEVALNILVPKILSNRATFEIFQYGSKQNLLDRLPSRLSGYKSWITDDFKIIILIDRDSDQCKDLKKRLNEIARKSGLIPKSRNKNRSFNIVNRIAIEELESWFFGDIQALCTAYPRVPSTLNNKKGFRNPDAIRGGTWEALEQVLQRAGHHLGGLAKQKAAKDISIHMDPDRNISKSFCVFRDTLKIICAN